MSTVVLFYVRDGQAKATIVRGQGFIFVNNLLEAADEQKVCQIIDAGAENNGYHYNSVTNEYEFWTAGKFLDSGLDVNNLSELKKNYDGVFKVDPVKVLVQVR